MSKFLVAFYNGTNETIKFINKEDSGDNQVLPPGSMFTTKVHFNVPDNSDPKKYFAEHHMELQNEKGSPIFSFWDDDSKDYVMMYCKGTDWEGNGYGQMPGTAPYGNEKDVGVALTGDFPNYEIRSCSAKYGV